MTLALPVGDHRSRVPALIAAALLGGTAVPVLAGVPWAAIAVLYSAFHGYSYRDLIEAGPRFAAALRRPAGLWPPQPGPPAVRIAVFQIDRLAGLAGREPGTHAPQ